MSRYVQNFPTHDLSIATRTAMQRYGIETCLWAFEQHYNKGEGAGYIGGYGRGGRQRGDAMINAGREMVTGSRAPGISEVKFERLSLSARFTCDPRAAVVYEKIDDYSARMLDRPPGSGPQHVGQNTMVRVLL